MSALSRSFDVNCTRGLGGAHCAFIACSRERVLELSMEGRLSSSFHELHYILLMRNVICLCQWALRTMLHFALVLQVLLEDGQVLLEDGLIWPSSSV